MSYLCNSDLQNEKELKQFSSFTLLMTCTMAILADMKYFGKKTCKHFGCWKNAPKVHQRIHIKWLSHGQSFNFMANLNIDCWMSMEAIDNSLGTHASMLLNYLGVAKGFLITFKCLQKLSSSLDCNQYCGYTKT